MERYDVIVIGGGSSGMNAASRARVASVGLGEEAAREAGHEVAVGRYSFAETGRGVAMGETRGQVKLVADKGTRELLGAHIIGPWADALIHEAIVAIGSRLTVDDLKEPRAIHIHPTLSEAVTWAADEIQARFLGRFTPSE